MSAAKLTRRTLLLLTGALGLARAARAQGLADLKAVPDNAIVKELVYCKGGWRLAFRDGSSREMPEYNLRLKTDSTVHGPLPGRPVLLPGGMVGDRFFLVFAAPEEIGALIRRC